MAKKPTRGKAGGVEVPTAGGGAEDLPERWSAQRKMARVLRLLRGEPLDAVSRESPGPEHELEGWKRVVLEAGGRGRKSRSNPEARELTLARAKVGELTMRLELAEYLIEKSYHESQRHLHARPEGWSGWIHNRRRCTRLAWTTTRRTRT